MTQDIEEKRKLEHREAYNKYQVVRRTWLTLSRHIKKVSDPGYTSLSDNGLQLLEAEERKLRLEMRDLERQLR